MWHTKASYLQYSYNLMFASDSVNQIGTLKIFREKYSRKNVTASKVLDCYEGYEELFESVGKAYIVIALMKFFGMEAVNDKPTARLMSQYSSVQEYFDAEFGQFIDIRMRIT